MMAAGFNNTGSRINVVISGKVPYPEGMAGTKRIRHFVDYLQCRDATVALLLLRTDEAGVKNESAGCCNGTPFRKIGTNLQINYSLVWSYPLYVWDGFRCLSGWKRKNCKNIFFCYGSPSIENICLVLSAKMLGYKIVFDIVEDYSVVSDKLSKRAKYKIRSLLFFEKHLRFLADGLVVISRHLYDKYSGALKTKAAVKLIPASAKVEEVAPKLMFNSPVRVVYSGSFASKDGVDNLIEAFESVCLKEKNMVLFLTGRGDDENMARIERQISGNDSIRYIGYLKDDEFYRFLREADILCMTRIASDFANAGFPFKLGEYLATGNPVITSACGDVGFYLENMKDAVLVEPGNVTELRNAIELLLTEQKKAMDIGRSGREKCREFFDPAKNGEKLAMLFDDI